MTEVSVRGSLTGKHLEVVIKFAVEGHKPTLGEVDELIQALMEAIDRIGRAVQLKSFRDTLPDALTRSLLETALRTFLRAVGTFVGPSVQVHRISMNSPLTLELILGGAGGAGTVSALVYLFKHPDKLGEWFPKVQTSWYNGRAEAEKARKAYEKLHRARTEVRQIER
ncbi:hypothetical protein [Streptosporangium sp. NPDC002524]|uniref:hypothetical protein n=1 Tax=Streptosporangium sp. NPDC002524 TaxID=3154537 RepID=UPI00332B8A08